MIIPNLVIGTDRYGHKLHCGDICKFEIKLQRHKCEDKVKKMKGMIVYDEDSYAYAFETLDDFALSFVCIVQSTEQWKNYLKQTLITLIIFQMAISGEKFIITM